VSVLLGALLLWVDFLRFENVQLYLVAVAMPWDSPLIAGFLASHLDSQNILLISLSMVSVAAILSVSLNTASQALGKGVDFPGVKGGVLLYFLVLASASLPAAVSACTRRSLSTRANN
jgi:MFS-type transporter involved in bile tolerance (Atg22 family)